MRRPNVWLRQACSIGFADVLRARLILVLAAVCLSSAACGGGSSSKAPLTLAQRLPTKPEIPGWSSSLPPGAAELPWQEGGTHARWTSADVFWSQNRDQLIRASLDDAKRVFTDAGFVGAIAHSYAGKTRKAGELPSLAVFVLQFGSEQGAIDASQWRHDDVVKPCPMKCDVSIADFAVSDVPDSWGVRRHVTQASIDATGDTELHPYDSYDVAFTDDEFVYVVFEDGPPGSVSETNVVAVAKALNERVHGAPAPAG
jgi:hypothetical protein